MRMPETKASEQLGSFALKGLGFAFLIGNLPLLFLVSVPSGFTLIGAAGGIGILAMGYLYSSKVEWRSKLVDASIYIAVLLAMLNQFLMNAAGEVGSGLFWTVLVLFYLMVYRKNRVLIFFILLHIIAYFYLNLILSSSGFNLPKLDTITANVAKWLGFLVCSSWTLSFISRSLDTKSKDQKEQL